MTDLIAELEQAQEGSRELDARVAVEWLYLDCTDEAYVKLPNQYDTEARRGDYWLVQRSGKQLKAAPHYTTNLQDALGLVPEGTYWAVRTTGDTFSALVVPEDQNHRPTYAATPALALTIAALRAWRDKEQEE